jgi:hypothetical protein
MSRVPARRWRCSGDHHARRESEQDRAVGGGSAGAGTTGAGGGDRSPRPLEPQEPDQQHDHPDRAGDPQPFAEDPDPDEHREQWRRATGDRIDDRQVAAPVRGREKDEVGRLDEP